MTVTERVQLRLQGDPKADDTAMIQELCDLATVRICLRVGDTELPAILEPIAADVVVKLFRRWNYEGISSEGADTISTTFVEDVLSEYADEFQGYIDQKKTQSGAKVVRFL